MLFNRVKLHLSISLLTLSSALFANLSGDIKTSITEISPDISAEAYYQTHKDDLTIRPDGTGLQILFESNHHYYLLAGPRAQKLLTLNGGKIEDANASFLQQLKEEYNEETFGQLQITQKNSHYYLLIKGKAYPLTIHTDKTMLQEKPQQFAYVTFTGVANHIDKEALINLADELTPTALFWEKLGSYLYLKVKEAPQGEQFSTYWQAEQDNLNAMLAQMTHEYERLMQEKSLIITPELAFNVATIEQAWDILRNINNYQTLKFHFQNTVGRYSERKGYYLFDAAQLLLNAQNPGQNIYDIRGEYVTNAFFNLDAITRIFPLIVS